MSVSVLILTRNEEDNLGRCLESVKWSDDIVVFDSFSTDRTLDIARSAGARVVQRVFDDERSQRSASLRVAFKYPWVYNPDADEVTTEELRNEILRVVADPARCERAYRVRRKDTFMGRWLRHSSLYPTWFVRLFRPEAVTFERDINLRYVVHGPEGRLAAHLLHYSFNKGLQAWIEKHNRYSTLEAAETLASLSGRGVPWRDLISKDAVARRRALKELSLRLPCRPTLRFLYTYLLKLGFLDGRRGFTYSRLTAMYEYMIVLKARELHRRNQGLPI